MANRSTQALGAASVLELGGSLRGERLLTVPMGAFGVTQRPPDVGGGSARPPRQGKEAVEDKVEQTESLKAQQQQVGLLQQNKALLERALNARAIPPVPTPLAQVTQTARDAVSSLLVAGGGYLLAKGIAQAPAAIGKTWSGSRGTPDSEGHPDGAQVSTPARPGTVYLPALLIGGTERKPVMEDYPLGADAGPAPVPRPAEPGRWARALLAGKSAAGMAGLDAGMKLIFTATTASTPDQVGEGVGGAIGGFLGAVPGAMLGGKLKAGAPVASLAFSFVGDKVGGALGKALMAAPGDASRQASATNTGGGQSTPPVSASSPSPATTLWGTLAGAVGIGAGAAAFRHRGRLSRLARGKRSPMLEEPYPLGADAGPSPTGINPAAGRWTRLKDAFKAPGKLPWLEAGMKAGYTYATAKTPEEKGAGYGGAIGGAVGTALGGLLLGGIVGPPVAMLIGNAVGDKVGGVVGGWIGKTLFAASDGPREKHRSAIALRDPRQITQVPRGEVIDEQVGTRMARQLLSPTAPLRLPEADPSPAQGQGATAQPVTQQFTFTANMPITVQGSIDAPNQLAQQLEEAVRRVMQDLHRQAYNAQLADHPNAF